MARSLRLTPLVALAAGTLFIVLSLPAHAGQSVLAPPETSSPRAAIHSFIERLDEMYQTAREVASPFERRAALRPRFLFMVHCFDQRELAPTIATSKSLRAAVCLKEIFDRIELPPEDQIPDYDEAKADGLKLYRIPGTEITLVRIDEGNREGDWVFNTETIQRAPEFYDRIKDEPYTAQASTRGLYEMYLTMQGWLIPAAWIKALPEWAKTPILEQALWQWAALVLLCGMAVMLVLASARLGRGGSKSQFAQSRLYRHCIRFAFPLTWIGMTVLLDTIFSSQIRMTGEVLIVLKIIFRLQTFLASIVMLLIALNLLAELVIRARQLRPGGVDSQLIRLGFRVLTFFLVAWVAVIGAEYLGIPITPLIAGLGVSGLAVALAAQYTVENLIAGIVIFADKPVRLGDFCRFDDILGTVEQIGLRSTRIRALDRTLVAIPNAEFAKLKVANYTKRDNVLMHTTLQLRYETTTDQLRYVLAELRTLLKNHPRILPEQARVRFIALGSYSLDIEIFALADTSDWSEYLQIQEEIFLAIMLIIDDAGTGFAFPSQVEYQAKDLGIDPERGRRAEEKVRQWRVDGGLASAGFSSDLAAAAESRLAPATLSSPPARFPAGPHTHLKPHPAPVDDWAMRRTK